MLQRIKRLWLLSKKDPKALEILESLKPEQLAVIPDAEIGDGKAVFFGEPTPEDQLEHEREEKGMKPWFDRLKEL